MINIQNILQVVSVVSLGLGAILNLKKNKWCFLLYQIGATARCINYINVGLHIELIVQVFFTYMNVVSFMKWHKASK